MVELYLTQNNNQTSVTYGKYYPRVSYKQTFGIHEMARHMAEHNTPFSEGTIEGILRDFVKCTREQTLMGNTVKIDNLAIFKVSVEGNPLTSIADARAVIGAATTVKRGDDGQPVTVATGNAVKSMKMLAQATGDYSKAELNKDALLGWTDKTQAEIEAAKAAAAGGSGSGGGSSESGGGSSSGGSEGGSDAPVSGDGD